MSQGLAGDTPQGEDSAKASDPTELSIDYIKSNFFRVMFADGFIVGGTPTGMIHVEFFNARAPIPIRDVFRVSADGHLAEALPEKRVARPGIVREVEGEIIMQTVVAKQLISVLTEGVKKAEALLEHIKSHQPNPDATDQSDTH